MLNFHLPLCPLPVGIVVSPIPYVKVKYICEICGLISSKRSGGVTKGDMEIKEIGRYY
ncbi:MAG: hypothetical protein AB1422_13890 [bacterium]